MPALESPVQPSRAVSTQTYAEIQVQPILALLREASNSSNKIIAQKEQKNAYKIAQASTPLSTSGSPDQVAANLKAEPIQRIPEPLITQDIGATIARPSSEQDDTTAHEILIVATNDQLESEDITPIFVPVTGISLACELVEAEPTQSPRRCRRADQPQMQLQSVNMEVQPFVPDHGSKAEDLIPDEIPAPVNPSCQQNLDQLGVYIAR